MPVVKNDFPILEYDTEKIGVVGTNRHKKPPLPEICVMTFFGEVLGEFINTHNAEIRYSYISEMRDFPIYSLTYHDVEICVVQAVVGSASIAAMTDYLIGHGVKKLIVCGGCGVLADIPAGDVIVPTVALRDEGASYHYLPPSREIELDKDMISAIESVLNQNHVPYIECKTWTTDGFYRETPDMIAYRKEEGCQVVEMECATVAAIAKFRGIMFGQLLYSGDSLADPKNYDDRAWSNKLTAREKLFALSLEAAVQE